MTLGLFAILMMAASLQSAPVRTVDAVDLNRYLGDWFEIARFPNRFQRACTGDVRATYARRSDGRIDVVNRCRAADGHLIEAQGVARVVDARTSAKLKVRFAPAVLSFLPFVWGDYWIVGLADDYAWAVVGSPDRSYLWILARSRTLDPARLEAALAAARANGFETDRLVMTRHTSTNAR
ncbi:MAG TPA: lipocalin family protein [Vicinamibacterales bacterium]|nr:lipocalin family protein [Vicinamibacterales bacterium]